MDNLDTIIAFEHEHTALDFKLVEYGKYNKTDLMKDVMSMANAVAQSDRLIIIGMKPDAAGRGISGIDKLTDAASLQQLILENIEPEISLTYTPYTYDGKLLGILRIYNCNAQPYLMKKDFLTEKTTLRRGDGIVRMGTTQTRVYRAWFEQVYQERYEQMRFSGEVEVSFIKEEMLSQSEVREVSATSDDLPSSVQRKKIQRIIRQKEKQLKQWQDMGLAYDEDHISDSDRMAVAMSNIHGGGVAYEHRSLATLRRNLENVGNTYYDEDWYFLLETNGEKLGLFIKNTGKHNLQAVRVVMHIPKINGLLIAKSLPKQPGERFPAIGIHYPIVEESGEAYEVSHDLGDLKPQLCTKLFPEPLRFCVMPKISVKIISLTLFVYANELSAPIEKTLQLVIKDSEPPANV